MTNIKRENITYRGTSVKLGGQKRDLINKLINVIANYSTKENIKFEEISIPIIQFQKTFESKIGKENSNLMFRFKDLGDRELCLAPEYTAVVQKLGKEVFEHVEKNKDICLFYIGECFRHERPQTGRYRQFTQFGVEILNPTKNWTEALIILAQMLISAAITPLESEKYRETIKTIQTNRNALRGLDYYIDAQTKLPIGKGFEITCALLGSCNQLCGGGTYEGGLGFALGIDRLLLLQDIIRDSSN